MRGSKQKMRPDEKQDKQMKLMNAMERGLSKLNK